MARTDSLTNFLTDIAESIRTANGTEDVILASEFDTEIAKLSTGGSSEYNAKMSNVVMLEGNDEDGYWYDLLSLIQELPNDLDISQLTDFSVSMPLLVKLPDNLDTSNLEGFIITNCRSLTSIPNYDFSKLTSFSMEGCSNITSVYNLNLNNLTYINRIFADCTNLIDVPQFDFSNVVIDDIEVNMFVGCDNLSDESLNNILATLHTVDFSPMVVSVGKRLSIFGLSQEQANKCITLSNWSTLKNDGWTTGY